MLKIISITTPTGNVKDDEIFLLKGRRRNVRFITNSILKSMGLILIENTNI